MSPIHARHDLARAVRAARDVLAAAGLDSPDHDARALAAHALDRPDLVVALVDELPAGFAARYGDLVSARARRVPLQHLTGSAAFHTLDLIARPGVFVPRPETEVLVEAALERIGPGPRVVLDACTGTGAIALAIAAARPDVRVLALEVDGAAVALAQQNTERLGLAGQVAVATADVRDAAAVDTARREHFGQRPLDLVVSNPPYLPAGAVPRQAEALADPPRALFGGGQDGLEVPRCIMDQARRALRPGGHLLMEHADLQGIATRAALHEVGGFDEITTLPDLTGRDRVLSGRRTTAGRTAEEADAAEADAVVENNAVVNGAVRTEGAAENGRIGQ